LAENGATEAEIEILLHERVELNALTSDALIDMIERKLKAYGLKKVIPDDALLREAFKAFHESEQLSEIFEEAVEDFKARKVKIPGDLRKRVQKILDKHPDLRWDDALQIVIDDTQLDRVREKKQKAKETSGDFTSEGDDE
jgi:chromosome condensin MukBEF complex kleisin-like MukF subunit